MNTVPTAALDRPRSNTGGVGNAGLSLLANVSNDAQGRKRTHDAAGLDSSPGSLEEGYDGNDGNDDKRRQPGVKRACNECRQQKVSHATPILICFA